MVKAEKDLLYSSYPPQEEAKYTFQPIFNPLQRTDMSCGFK
jgi:hypothetical protein